MPKNQNSMLPKLHGILQEWKLVLVDIYENKSNYILNGKVAERLWRVSQVSKLRLGFIRLLQTSGVIRVGSNPTLLIFAFFSVE